MPKVILDLCGGTGAWSKPYRDAGYTVHVITLPLYDVTQVEFYGCFMDFIRDDKERLTVACADVYGILAAPPCTEFSVAKGNRPRDFLTGLKVVDACLKIIWRCQTHGGRLKFWGLENPVGLLILRRFLGKPAYTFYQWQFGDLGIKRTDVWGRFNSPKQTVFERPDDPYFVKQYKSGKKSVCPDWAKDYIAQQPNKRAALRAITPPGFAEAFYKANK